MIEFELIRDLPLATGVALGSVAMGEVARLGIGRWFDVRRRTRSIDLATAAPRTEAAESPVPTQPQKWRGYRRFRVESTRMEGRNARSIWLAPEDGLPLSNFLPGQFITLRLTLPDDINPSIRCYSLSDVFEQGRYRITVKRNTVASETSVSAFLVDHLKESEIIEVQAPKGGFVFDFADQRMPIFLAAGIGVTPLFTMAKALAMAEPARKFLFALGVRCGSDHPLKDDLGRMAANHGTMRYFPLYSKPAAEDRRAHDYVRQGRVDTAWFTSTITSPDHPFYLCGPQSFLQEATHFLDKLGVAPGDVRLEAFGPSSLHRPVATTASSASAAPARVHFRRSNKEVLWSDSNATLLELAESQGVSIPSSCRSGNCGTCAVKLLKGKLASPESNMTSGSDECLACVSKNDGVDVDIDA
jgi:ferredoxin-NADP reductase